MSWRSGLWLLLVLVVACTEPNPRSCADGTCTDPSLPFCDVDGALAGTPNTCIAVSCSPGEHALCRGDTAVRCNATGNDYDLIQCESGCSDSHGGCIRCSSDVQCANPAPICDTASNTCRACQSDDECPSSVCDLDTGACAASSAVVYASPDGTETGTCTQVEPCELRRAGNVAATSGIGKTLRLLPGSYTTPLVITQPTSLEVVATGAQLESVSGLHVSGGATVAIRDLVIQVVPVESTEDVKCGSALTSTPRTSLTLANVTIGARSSLGADRCNLRIENSLVEGGIFLRSDSALEEDRVRHRHPRGEINTSIGIAASGTGVSARVVNSIFFDKTLELVTIDAEPPGLRFSAAFNTFIFNAEGESVRCNTTSAVRDVRFENNIIYVASSANAAIEGDCDFENNILYPQANPITRNIVADPQFVDFANDDFRLKAGSPAIDTAVPSTGLSTLHDFDGTTRPQGAAHDIGAFERVP